MDWITLLLIFIFFVLPLIQQIAEARKRGSQPRPEEDAHEGWTRADGGETEIWEEPGVAGGGVEWSGNWGSWPTPQAEREVPEPVGPEQARESTPRRVSEPAHYEPVVVIPPPEVTVIPPEIRLPRAAEPRPAIPAPSTRPATARPPKAPRTTVRPTSPVARQLRGSADVRRAIILSEVLGPPKSLRPDS